MNKNKVTPFIIPSLFIITSVAFAIAFVSIAIKRPLTNLEGVLLQIITLSLGIIGSFLFGKITSNKIALNIIKPHARSAFRRLVSLYKSLSRVAGLIDAQNESEEKIVLAKIQSIVIEQIATADDALEDWRDIIPQEVEDISNRLKRKESYI